MADRLEEIESSWSMYFEDADGPPVADVRWLIDEVKTLRQLLRMARDAENSRT